MFPSHLMKPMLKTWQKLVFLKLIYSVSENPYLSVIYKGDKVCICMVSLTGVINKMCLPMKAMVYQFHVHYKVTNVIWTSNVTHICTGCHHKLPENV